MTPIATAPAPKATRITLAAIPGPLYRFESVELPGLEVAAGDEASKLRDAFAVKAGDPVIAQKVIDAGVALQVALGERGFATAKVGEVVACRAWLVHGGRMTQVWDAEAVNETTGKTMAVFRCTQMVLYPR